MTKPRPQTRTRDQAGMTLAEALVVTLILSLIAAFAGSYSMEWLRAERLRSGTYLVYLQLSLARVEAVERNRACRFTLDTATRRLQVIDLNDPAIDTDDEILQSETLDASMEFGAPGGGGAVTLENPAGTLFQTTFGRDGTVTSGAGSIGFVRDTVFKRVSVFVGGGVAIHEWNGSSWEIGS